MTNCQKKIDKIVEAAIEGNGLFYSVRFEPIPSKTCFDVSLKTFGIPSIEHIVTVTIPKTYPFTPPTIISKTDKKIQFKFLRKSQWKSAMGIREVLIEACNVISRRDLAPRRPVLAPIRLPPHLEKSPAKSPSHSPAARSPITSQIKSCEL